MQALAAAGIPGKAVALWLPKKGEGTFRAEKATAGGCAASVPARNTSGGMPTPPPTQHCLRAGRIWPEAAPDRPQYVHEVAGLGTTVP